MIFPAPPPTSPQPRHCQPNSSLHNGLRAQPKRQVPGRHLHPPKKHKRQVCATGAERARGRVPGTCGNGACWGLGAARPPVQPPDTRVAPPKPPTTHSPPWLETQRPAPPRPSLHDPAGLAEGMKRGERRQRPWDGAGTHRAAPGRVWVPIPVPLHSGTGLGDSSSLGVGGGPWEAPEPGRHWWDTPHTHPH